MHAQQLTEVMTRQRHFKDAGPADLCIIICKTEAAEENSRIKGGSGLGGLGQESGQNLDLFSGCISKDNADASVGVHGQHQAGLLAVHSAYSFHLVPSLPGTAATFH